MKAIEDTGAATRRISIPEELRPLPIHMLDAGLPALNSLAKERVVTLGNLDGVTEDQLLRVDGMGPVRVDSIFRAVEKAHAMKEALIERHERDPTEFGEKWPTYDDPVWSLGHGVPAWLRARRLPALRSVPWCIETLARYGITTVGDIWHLSDARLQLFPGFGRRGVLELRTLLYAFEEIGPDRLAVITRPGWHPKLPTLPIGALQALLAATSPAEEILALVAGLQKRDAELWLRRACFRTWPRPRLGKLGEAFGISRERVRQIVRGIDDRLRDSGVRLPICSCIVQWIADREGATASTAELLALTDEWGMAVHEDELRALPHLGTLGVVPAVAYDAAEQIWTTA